MERTLSIIKPDAMKKNITGKINAMFEDGGLKIVAQKMIQLTREQARQFYIEHKERSFYNDLVEYMISVPVIVQVLQGENAILKNRTIMGKTNYVEAAEGTIRKLYATSIQENCVHGSDSATSAEREINFFFNKLEIF